MPVRLIQEPPTPVRRMPVFADAGLPDAGPTDSGVQPDAGDLPDASVALDAGGGTDAGLLADAGPQTSQPPRGCGCSTDSGRMPRRPRRLILVPRKKNARKSENPTVGRDDGVLTRSSVMGRLELALRVALALHQQLLLDRTHARSRPSQAHGVHPVPT